MAYRRCISIALGGSQIGLTLSAQLIDTAGANVGSLITTGFSEIGVGNYLLDYASFPDGHRGAIKFLTGATLRAVLAINPEDFENGDAKITSRLSTPQGVARNVALPKFTFVMYDTSGNPATGLTVTCRRSIDGGAEADCANTPATELSQGRYWVDLAAADLSGRVVAFRALANGALDTHITLLTVTSP